MKICELIFSSSFSFKGKTKFLRLSSFLALKTIEQILFQAKPLKILNKKSSFADFRVTGKVC